MDVASDDGPATPAYRRDPMRSRGLCFPLDPLGSRQIRCARHSRPNWLSLRNIALTVPNRAPDSWVVLSVLCLYTNQHIFEGHCMGCVEGRKKPSGRRCCFCFVECIRQPDRFERLAPSRQHILAFLNHLAIIVVSYDCVNNFSPPRDPTRVDLFHQRGYLDVRPNAISQCTPLSTRFFSKLQGVATRCRAT